MSRELLAIVGVPDAARSEERERLVSHAAATLPGREGESLHGNASCALAVVGTRPDGGSFSLAKTSGGRIVGAVACTTAGLSAAADAGGAARNGAEAGHVVVEVGPDGAVEVRNDGIGAVPAFWILHGGELYLSTHLASLVSMGVPATLDAQGIAEYLVLLHPLGERTVLEDVSLLPPGAVLRWRPGGAVQLTTAPIFVPDPRPLSDDGVVDAFRDVWMAVMSDVFERNAGARVAVGLSGGLDSRAVAAGAALVGRSPLTFSYGDDRVWETRVAAKVAGRLGLDHLQLPVTAERVMPDAGGILERLDGVHSPAEMYESWFERRLAEVADVLVNGAGGGPLWGDEKTLGLSGTAEIGETLWHKYRGAASAVTAYLLPDAGSEVQDRAREGFASSLTRWADVARTDVSVYWRIANRQVRWGNALVTAVRRAGLRSEVPFLDGRFLQLAARLTPEQRLNGVLHLRVHREVFPATSGIGRADDGNSPNGLSHVYWSADRSYARQLADLTMHHPVSGFRRAGRRIAQVGVHGLEDVTGSSRLARAWDTRAGVFPLDTWARDGGEFARRLADYVDVDDDQAGPVSAESLHTAAAQLRAGTFHGSAAALAKAATVHRWSADFRDRGRRVSELTPVRG